MSDEQKREAIRELTEDEFIPQIVSKSDFDLSSCESFELSDLSVLLPAVLPTIRGLRFLTGSLGVGSPTSEVLYRAILPKGASKLAYSHRKGGFIGAALDKNNKLMGQAALDPIGNSSVAQFNPYLIVISAMMMDINKKLKDINEGQKYIISILENREKAELEGNLTFLSDIINNYQFHYDNEMYRNNSHVKVLDIKQTSEQSIIRCKRQAESDLEARGLLLTGKAVKSGMEKLLRTFEKYCIAVYLYAFSSYTEVLLLESFEKEYLDRIIEKIQKYALEYREIYTVCYSGFERVSRKSIQSLAVRGAAGAAKRLGQAVKKHSKSESEKAQELIGVSDRLIKADEKSTEKAIRRLTEYSSVDVSFFIERLRRINHLFNDPIILAVSDDKLYIDSMSSGGAQSAESADEQL